MRKFYHVGCCGCWSDFVGLVIKRFCLKRNLPQVGVGTGIALEWDFASPSDDDIVFVKVSMTSCITQFANGQETGVFESWEQVGCAGIFWQW